MKAELLSLAAGSRPFFDAAEAGIDKLGESIQAADGSSTSAPAPELQEASQGMGIADDPELIADFIVESREHLRAIEQNVLAVEQDRSQMDPIHAMFRAFHTHQGAVSPDSSVIFAGIRDISHETETLLDLARNSKLALTPAVIDVILESADYLSREVTRIEAGVTRESAPAGKLISRICAVSGGAGTQVEEDLTLISEAMAVAETIAATRRRTSRRPSPLKVRGGEERRRDGSSGADGQQGRGRPAQGRARGYHNQGGYSKAGFSGGCHRRNDDCAVSDPASSGSSWPKAQSVPVSMRNIAQLSRITSDVQKTALSMRMVPVGTLFQKMARLVRDLCRKSGKQADLVTFGDG